MLLRKVAPSSASRPLRAGFTLAELLAVVAILAVLAGVAIPAYMAIVSSSKVKVARSEAKTLAAALKNFAMTNNDEPGLIHGYPDPSSGFSYLVSSGILPKLPVDPWGNLYYWELVTNPDSGTYEPVVYSNGPSPGQAGSVISSID